MRRYIKAVGAGQKRARSLTRDEARAAMTLIATGAAEPVQVGAFFLALRMKGETAEELAGFADALAEQVLRAPISGELDDGILEVDAHGDGHEGIASLLPAAACAAAATGIKVVLAVERGSPFARSGIEEGLAAIGLDGVLDGERAMRDVARAGVGAAELARTCPVLARLVALRPLLGVRSAAHTVAKLVSSFAPTATRTRLVGVFHAPYLEPTAAALALLGIDRGLVVQALGGLPEARPGRAVRVASVDDPVARVVSLRGFAAHPIDPASTNAIDPAEPSERGAATAGTDARAENRAALDGDPVHARRAAAAAALMISAATGADPVAAAEAALVVLLDGRAAKTAARLA